ncbi:hypothetical protein PCH_Pc21g10280 [Penicillium rubens Wisconsin 54-1255]|uniref:Uncharacterized protein n=1 Tax=Penicillium rubens (strain ATCC 28089 / DSM 1075 / NRRL 1951 / Wisconsin 54-1255) TaxID=500485 RepID=B6HIH5_PENRW|nr:hypothetical protein PCH_Pc21g10280 [Penicillium rubens Wisconsin 54-1255]
MLGVDSYHATVQTNNNDKCSCVDLYMFHTHLYLQRVEFGCGWTASCIISPPMVVRICGYYLPVSASLTQARVMGELPHRAPDTDGMCIAGDIQGQSKAAMWKLSEPTRVSGILKVSAYLD